MTGYNNNTGLLPKSVGIVITMPTSSTSSFPRTSTRRERVHVMVDKQERNERKANKMGPLQTTLRNSLNFSLQSVNNVLMFFMKRNSCMLNISLFISYCFRLGTWWGLLFWFGGCVCVCFGLFLFFFQKKNPKTCHIILVPTILF